jgi:hypothetical protein
MRICLRIEEAEKRDHRRLGRQLDLFHIQDEAPGMVFWHPKGWTVWQQVEQYMRRVYQDNGYLEVKCPQILDRSLWEKSGHWENFKENMFTTESEKRDFAIKPMNCPGHVQIFNAALRSYRELPLRYGEFGNCHRNEPSGALHGIMRVRGFTQDDGPHLLLRGPDPAGGHRFQPAGAGGLRGFRLCRRRDQDRATPGQAARVRRDLGSGGKRIARGAAGLRGRVAGTPRRGRVLRPQGRISPQGFDRPVVAMRARCRRISRCPAGWGPNTSTTTTPARCR